MTKTIAEATLPTCTGPECIKTKIAAKGLCMGHYRQVSRGQPLTPLRKLRGLVRLAAVIRVEEKTLGALHQRIKEGLAVSLYDSTRQALEAGVAALQQAAAIETLLGAGLSVSCKSCGCKQVHTVAPA